MQDHLQALTRVLTGAYQRHPHCRVANYICSVTARECLLGPTVLQAVTPAATALIMTSADATVPRPGDALIPRISRVAHLYLVPCSSPVLVGVG